MNLLQKLGKTRKIMREVMNIKKDSKSWLCDGCRKKTHILTKRGVPFVKIIMESEVYLCEPCSTQVKKSLSKYKNYK